MGTVEQKGSSVLKLLLALIPVVAIVVIYLNTGDQGGSGLPLPVVGGIVVLFLLIFAMAHFMRRAGHGPGVVVVDRTKGTVSWRASSRYSSRHTLPLGELRELVIVKKGAGSAGSAPAVEVLYLVTQDGKGHQALYSREPGVMRKFAEELSGLTSLSIREKMA